MTLCHRIVTHRWAVRGSPVLQCGFGLVRQCHDADPQWHQSCGRRGGTWMWPYAWAVPGKNGPGVPSATPPGGGSGGGSGGTGSGCGSGSGGGTGRGRGPADPAMVWAAATAAAPGAAAAALAAVAVAGPAALPVRGASASAMPASAGWDRRILRPRALRERGTDLLPLWDTSRLDASYPSSGRVRAGDVHAGQGRPVLCATAAGALAARCSPQTFRTARLVTVYRPGQACRADCLGRVLYIEAGRREAQEREEKGYVRQELRCRSLPRSPKRMTQTGPRRAAVSGTFASGEPGRGEMHYRGEGS